MEAATASTGPLLTRDGGVPAAPAPTGTVAGHPIDGVVRCTCCERFPLVGERVIRHAGAAPGEWVCESCEAGGRGERLGAVIERHRIRSLGGAMNVRRAD